jgi:chromosome segregation ATPase
MYFLFKGNFEIMDQQREKIAFLEAECEKHLNEKHIACERRINELTQECQNNVGFIEAQKNQLRTLSSHVEDLEKQMEKNKLELQSFNFKEFIAVKRELAQLKQEREKQFAESMTKKNGKDIQIKPRPEPLPLPPIQHSTEVKEKKTSFKFFH